MKRFVFLALLALFGAAAYGAYVWLTPAPAFHGTLLETPRPLGEVTLAAGNERVTLAQWQGRLVVVFFGFTRCPDICPLTMARLAHSYRQLGEPAEVQVVMITVDPARDTPEVMQHYAAQFHPDFVGLSGTAEDIAHAARAFFVGFRELAGGQFTHTDAIFLLDRQTQMRLVYRQDNVLRLEEDLQTILAQRLW
ncbi:MAG: SCO family protein [Truepera sp.]|nr:SCO family protein [Truepera sp.]MBS3968075.1 SCO family protein [Truepera sp.]